MARRGKARRGKAGSGRHGRARQGSAGQGRRGWARPGKARSGSAGMVGSGGAKRVAAVQVMTGTEWPGKVLCGNAGEASIAYSTNLILAVVSSSFWQAGRQPRQRLSRWVGYCGPSRHGGSALGTPKGALSVLLHILIVLPYQGEIVTLP